MSLTRTRVVCLLVLALVVALPALFFETARRYGRMQVGLPDLPAPVRRAVEEAAGPSFTLVQIDRRPLPATETYLVTIEHQDGHTRRLWLTADGDPWPPER